MCSFPRKSSRGVRPKRERKKANKGFCVHFRCKVARVKLVAPSRFLWPRFVLLLLPWRVLIMYIFTNGVRERLFVCVFFSSFLFSLSLFSFFIYLAIYSSLKGDIVRTDSPVEVHRITCRMHVFQQLTVYRRLHIGFPIVRTGLD